MEKSAKKGGTIVLAWNSNLVNRKILGIFSNDFELYTEPPFDTFEHRVDSAIKRDIIVARKTRN